MFGAESGEGGVLCGCSSCAEGVEGEEGGCAVSELRCAMVVRGLGCEQSAEEDMRPTERQVVRHEQDEGHARVHEKCITNATRACITEDESRGRELRIAWYLRPRCPVN